MSSIVTDRNPMLSEEPAPMSTSQTTPEQGELWVALKVAMLIILRVLSGQAQNTTALEQDGAQPPIVPFKERVIGRVMIASSNFG
jgi:hypothetical protein